MARDRMLTTRDVRKLVSAIKDADGDDEHAHGLEDQMFVEVLRAIADGKCESPRDCAREALKTLDLDFSRWMA